MLFLLKCYWVVIIICPLIVWCQSLITAGSTLTPSRVRHLLITLQGTVSPSQARSLWWYFEWIHQPSRLLVCSVRHHKTCIFLVLSDIRWISDRSWLWWQCWALLWQWGRQTDNYWQVPWLVAAVRLTGSNWQLPANIERTSGYSESGGKGLSEARRAVRLANGRPRLDCVSIGTTSDTVSEAGWALSQIVRQMRGGGLLSSTHFQIKS